VQRDSKLKNSNSAPKLEEPDDVWSPPVPEVKKPREPAVGKASELARKHHLDLYEVKYILKLFIEADENDSGGLDKTEFTEVVRKVFDIPKGTPVPDRVVNNAWEKMMASSDRKDNMVEANPDIFIEWYVVNMFSDAVQECKQDSAEAQSYDLAKKHNLDVASVDKIKKKFDQFDIDRSGKIDYKEFMQMLVYVLKAPSAADIAEDRATRFWQEIDLDGSGEIEFPEFVGWFVKYFNVNEDEMDLSKGPVGKFYDSFNPMKSRRASVGE
jgi:Ca2+-binding EF-hand superfamily protein